MANLKTKQWLSKAVSSESVDQLAKELGVHPVTAQLLVNRGLEEASLARQFLNPQLNEIPNPFLMKDMEKAVFFFGRSNSKKTKNSDLWRL